MCCPFPPPVSATSATSATRGWPGVLRLLRLLHPSGVWQGTASTSHGNPRPRSPAGVVSPMRTAFGSTPNGLSLTGQPAGVDRFAAPVTPRGLLDAGQLLGERTADDIRSAASTNTVRMSASSFTPMLSSVVGHEPCSTSTHAARARGGQSPPAASAIASSGSHVSAGRSVMPGGHGRVGAGEGIGVCGGTRRRCRRASRVGFGDRARRRRRSIVSPGARRRIRMHDGPVDGPCRAGSRRCRRSLPGRSTGEPVGHHGGALADHAPDGGAPRRSRR